MSLIDLTGKRFGKLVVLKRGDNYVSSNGNSAVRWLCQCDCGNKKLINSASLRNGCTKSCGCEWGKEHIEIKIFDNVAVFEIKNKKILIDKEDISKIENDNFHISKAGYVARNKDKKLLHRIIMDAPKGKMIDHINHNKLDNRKQNLRVADFSINGYNKALQPSKTGEFGIVVSKDGYYKVQIDSKYIGCSKFLHTAIDMRDKALLGSKALRYNYYLRQQRNDAG